MGPHDLNLSDLDRWFDYHPPTDAQRPHYIALRAAGLVFAQAILEHTPTSADQTAAIRHVRDAVMTANAAIACEGQ